MKIILEKTVMMEIKMDILHMKILTKYKETERGGRQVTFNVSVTCIMDWCLVPLWLTKAEQ